MNLSFFEEGNVGWICEMQAVERAFVRLFKDFLLIYEHDCGTKKQTDLFRSSIIQHSGINLFLQRWSFRSGPYALQSS